MAHVPSASLMRLHAALMDPIKAMLSEWTTRLSSVAINDEV